MLKPSPLDLTPVIANKLQELLTRSGFGQEVTVSVTHISDPDQYQISLRTPEPALLIGFHGEALSSFQLILSLHLHASTQTWSSLSLNVNDYRERREANLISLAETAVRQVISTGQPHSLPPLPANERRIVHLHLSQHPQVATASHGTGRSRSVVVSLKPNTN